MDNQGHKDTGELPYVRLNPRHTTKFYELQAFLFLTVMMAPITAVILIGSYGFLVWFSQILG